MKTRVLIADDHKILRDGLRNLLHEQDNYQVVAEVENGREAVRLAKKLEPEVVIMDISMPDMNGIEATRRIKDILPDIKVLALSMHSDSRFVKQMIEAGASGYLLKECAFEELVTALRTLSRNRIYISPDASGGVIQDLIKHQTGTGEEETPLTPREREVLQLIAEGNPTSEIADRMHISVKTIESHRKNIMDKLNMRSIAELTKYAIREGITSLEP